MTDKSTAGIRLERATALYVEELATTKKVRVGRKKGYEANLEKAMAKLS